MPGSITSSNANLFLVIPQVFAAPQALQGFGVDDIFGTNDVPATEAMMGVDGHLAAGKVYVPVVQDITLMASSPSTEVFDAWAAAMENLGDVLFANMTVILLSIGKEYTCLGGTLTAYKKMPDARRVLQPRRYQITWEKVLPGRIQF